jgi:hypothetical protein
VDKERELYFPGVKKMGGGLASVGEKILIALAVAFSGAVIAMLVSGTAQKMTLATTKFENTGDQHH